MTRPTATMLTQRTTMTTTTNDNDNDGEDDGTVMEVDGEDREERKDADEGGRSHGHHC